LYLLIITSRIEEKIQKGIYQKRILLYARARNRFLGID